MVASRSTWKRRIAQEQLIKTLQDVVSSSLKVCQFSLVTALRISHPIRNFRDREDAERVLADRRQRDSHAVTRMNGGRAIPETLAQKRMFVGTLPARPRKPSGAGVPHAAMPPICFRRASLAGMTDSPVILLKRRRGKWFPSPRSIPVLATPTC